MKKLMFATALVASAAAFADGPLNANSFEGYTADTGVTVGDASDPGGNMYFLYQGDSDGSTVKSYENGDASTPSITRRSISPRPRRTRTTSSSAPRAVPSGARSTFLERTAPRAVRLRTFSARLRLLPTMVSTSTRSCSSRPPRMVARRNLIQQPINWLSGSTLTRTA